MKTTINKPSTLIAAIICITILSSIALLKDIDGTILSFALALLAGIAGFNARKLISPKK